MRSTSLAFADHMAQLIFGAGSPAGSSDKKVESEDVVPLKHSPTAHRLGGQMFYVFLGAVFTLVVGFPFQIYVARILGPAGLGTFGLIEGGIATISGFLGLGIAQCLLRFVPFHLERREYASVWAIIGTGALILFTVGIACYLALLGSLGWIGERWPDLATHRGVIALMGVMIPLGLIIHFLQQGLRGFHEIRYMVIGSSFVQLLVKVAVAVAAFAVGWGLFGYGLAVVLSTLCGALWMGYGLYGKLQAMPAATPRASRDNRAEWYRFAMVMYVSGLLSSAPAYLDRFVLGYFVGASAVGIFLIAVQLQQLPGMFNQMLLLVGAPMFAAAYGRNDGTERQHLYTLMTDWVVRASLPLMIFLVVFSRPVLGLFGPDFSAGGVETLFILLAGQFVNLLCGPVGNVALMNGLELYQLRINAALTGLGVVMTIALVPTLGLIGAAVAFAAAVVLGNMCVLVLIQRRLKIRWWDQRFYGWLVPAIAAFMIAIAVRGSGMNAGAAGLIVVLIAMYAVFLGASLLQGLHADDKDFLRHLHREFLRWR
jgi:O-antigen/teichoic acid export membrane protein